MWYMITVFESGVTWKSEIEHKMNTALAAAELESNLDVRRFLKASGKASSSGEDGVITAIDTDINWYYMSTQYTLAIFSVWLFDGYPKPATYVEGWFSVVMTVVASSFYAYLAGESALRAISSTCNQHQPRFAQLLTLYHCPFLPPGLSIY
jgi:hypothetical protein